MYRQNWKLYNSSLFEPILQYIPTSTASHLVTINFFSFISKFYMSACVYCQGRAYVLSNTAALRILAISSDVLFNTMEDVFVTGICRAIAGIGCTSIPGIPRSNNGIADCDVMSGRVLNIHHVTSPQQMMRLWNLANNSTATAAQRECGFKISTLHIAVICVALLFVIYCSFCCRRRILQRLVQYVSLIWRPHY